MTSKDAELVQQCKLGDISAFEKLLDEYEGKIYNMAYRMLGDRQDAEDATQETFMKAYTSLDGFRGDSSFSTWLYRIAKNVCLDEIRRRQRKPVYHLDEPVTTPTGQIQRQLPDESPAPDEVVVEHEKRRAIEEALGKLPPHHRTVIVLRDIQGLSYNEIAEILKVKLGTVKSRLYRARSSMSAVLQEMELFRRQGVRQGERREET